MNKFVVLLLLFGVLGCQAQKPSMDIEVIEDIVYNDGPDSDDKKHKLDLYLPVAIDHPPLLLWIHGGAWAFGDRKGEEELARRFAENGVAVAAMSYRLSPATWANPPKIGGVEHPAHIEDVAMAFDFLYKHAQKYGYDQSNLFVSGYSAGGHLSALLVLDERYLAAKGRKLADVKAAIPLAGAYDMIDYYESHKTYRGKEFADAHVKGVFGDSMEDLKDASVTTWLGSSAVPMLVIAESETTDYTKVFEEAANGTEDANISFHYLPDETHRSYFFDLVDPQGRHLSQIIEFIAAQSRS